MRSQPAARRKIAWVSSSTPSATTRMPSARAACSIEVTSLATLPSIATSLISERASFTVGMAPARQPLDADDAPVARVDHRLEPRLDLAGRDRAAQLRLEVHPPVVLGLEVGVERAPAAAALHLGAVERHVGEALQVAGVG